MGQYFPLAAPGGHQLWDEDEADEATSPQWQRISSMLMSGLAATGAGVSGAV